MPDKQGIKADFGRAAANYDDHAGLQKYVAANLVSFAGKDFPRENILDLGSGTGYLKELLNRRQITELDIAFAMCGKSRRGGGWQVNADMENLPFVDGVFSAVISSLALQWLENLDKTFAETARVLQPGGILAFSVFGAGTLGALAESLEKFDEGNRVNNFFSAREILGCLKQHFTLVKHSEENIVSDYRDVFDLQRKIRLIGGRKKGKSAPLTRKKVAAVNEYYLRNYPGGSGISATWNAHYFLAKKL